MPAALSEKLVAQSRAHPQWSYQLHADNLAAVATKEPALGPCPGYACVRRFLKAHGLFPRPRRGPVNSPGAQAAEARFAAREIRSYQSEQANALWHLDFHHGKVRVLLADGQWGYHLIWRRQFGSTDKILVPPDAEDILDAARASRSLLPISLPISHSSRPQKACGN